MKRTLVAVALSALAVPALAAGLPYDQNLVDRALPQIPERSTQVAPASDARLPYDQVSIDRALPNIPERDVQSTGRAYQGTTFEQFSPA